jgi:fermentation-respiration switch protein FrsA (DUF1100 family)
MYFPVGVPGSPADAGLPWAEPVTIPTPDGVSLGAWLVAPDQEARATVVVFNGNAGHRGYRAGLAARLRAAGFSVLLFDYRGYGGNAGSPSERGLLLDARAVRSYLAGRSDVDPRRLVYFGESLGTGVAVLLAAEHPPAALVLRSPYTSMTAVARYHYPILPVDWLLADRYPSIDVIGNVACPVLFILGDRDSIVPPSETRALYDAASDSKSLVVIEGADHNDAPLNDGAEMVSHIVSFVDQALKRMP